MQSDQKEHIGFCLLFESSKASVKELSFRFQGYCLVMEKQNCRIRLPVQNIGTVGKNGLNIILFLKDEARPEEDNWAQEDAEMEEIAPKEINQYNRLDSILFNMLKAAQKGGPFDNILKGDFQAELQFSQLSSLKVLKDQIQAIIQELQKNKQQSKFSMQIQGQEQQAIG